MVQIGFWGVKKRGHHICHTPCIHHFIAKTTYMASEMARGSSLSHCAHATENTDNTGNATQLAREIVSSDCSSNRCAGALLYQATGHASPPWHRAQGWQWAAEQQPAADAKGLFCALQVPVPLIPLQGTNQQRRSGVKRHCDPSAPRCARPH